MPTLLLMMPLLSLNNRMDHTIYSITLVYGYPTVHPIHLQHTLNNPS